MWGTPSLPSLTAPLSPGLVGLDRILFMNEIELNGVLMLNEFV